MNIEKIASKIFLGNNLTLNFRVEDLLKTYAIKLTYSSDLMPDSFNIKELTAEEFDLEIIISEDIKYKEYRMIVMKAFGYILMYMLKGSKKGLTLDSNFKMDNEKNEMCEKFARCILMPEEQIISRLHAKNIKALANELNLRVSLLEKRGSELKIW